MVVAFVNGEAGDSQALVQGIDKLDKTYGPKGLKTFVVYSGGPELKNDIEAVAKKAGTSIPLTFLPGGAKAPDIARYKLSPGAKNTVVVYKNKQVVANLVDVTPETWAQVEKATAEAVE